MSRRGATFETDCRGSLVLETSCLKQQSRNPRRDRSRQSCLCEWWQRLFVIAAVAQIIRSGAGE